MIDLSPIDLSPADIRPDGMADRRRPALSGDGAGTKPDAMSSTVDHPAPAGAYAVERAAGELRRGRPVVVLAGDGAAIALAIETADAATLTGLRSLGPIDFALTFARAQRLHIRTAGTDPTLVPLPADLALETLHALADPTLDLANPLKGPFTARRALPTPAEAAAVLLCKRARLLPAAVLHACGIEQAQAFAAARDLLAVDAAAVEAYEDGDATRLALVTSARVPLQGAEDARLFAFRPADGAVEHIAIMVGDPPRGDPVLARLHSECFTGDLLGSLRCDCGEQLQGAIAAIRRAGGGVVLYLAQEGRGIGLLNKLRAYRLQDQGFDTIEANERLGFEADERVFRPAAEMLRLLGFERVRLMTNNPEKVGALGRFGIEVVERVPHIFPANPHNAGYLATKKARAGHLF
jgi:GTP cyclohydrolase II